MKTVSGAQQDKNNCTFHVATDGRTYELQAHDEATMNKYVIDHTLYVTVSKLRSILICKELCCMEIEYSFLLCHLLFVSVRAGGSVAYST